MTIAGIFSRGYTERCWKSVDHSKGISDARIGHCVKLLDEHRMPPNKGLLNAFCQITSVQINNLEKNNTRKWRHGIYSKK